MKMMTLTKRTIPKKAGIKTKTIIPLAMALLMCMSLFIFPMTAYASETSPHTAPPTVEAEIVGSLLRIRAMSGFYAVEAVYVNSRRFNHRVDSALVIDISGYIATGEIIAVHAVDFAGNHSNTVLLTPPAPAQPPVPNNLTPDGQGQVLDHLTSADMVEFITITTPAGNVFHLVIDHTRSSNNVYFLNPVTEWDLLMLAAEAELPVPNNIIQVPPTTEPVVTEREPTETTETSAPEPVPEVPDDDDGGRGGMYIFLLIAGAGAFGLIYYIKILKPKKEREMYGGDEQYEEDDGFEDIEDGEDNEDSENNEDNSGGDIDADGYDVDDGKYYKEGE
jgi:hypothetical protein